MIVPNSPPSPQLAVIKEKEAFHKDMQRNNDEAQREVQLAERAMLKLRTDLQAAEEQLTRLQDEVGSPEIMETASCIF